MNDRIAQMAREADPGFGNDDGDMPDAIVGKEAIARFARLVAEDCAKVCDEHQVGGIGGWKHNTPQDCALAIRARYK